MPIEIISGIDALAGIGKTREARWPTKPGDSKRIVPFAAPECYPSFTLKPKSRIFTIGSCFARNIEKYLHIQNFELPTYEIKGASQHLWHTDPMGIINKYVPYAIYNEFRWALEDDAPFPDPDGYLEEAEGKWIDPQLPVGGTGMDLDEARKRRRLISRVHSEVARCSTVIMTLGLVEAWRDNKTELYLNRMPPKYAINKEPDRFDLVVLQYNEIVDCLEKIRALLRRHMGDFNLLLTVSPVPFVYSFRNKDAMISNMYSKSVLRAAAEEFVTAHDGVDYFPSYESVMLSERSKSWKEDRLHVTDTLVGRIVSKVIDSYTDSSEKEKSDFLIASADMQMRQNNWKEAVYFAQKALENDKGKSKDFSRIMLRAQFMIAKAQFFDRDNEAAIKNYEAVLELAPNHYDARIGLARSFMRIGQPKQAVSILKKALKLASCDHQAGYFLGIANERIGKVRLARKNFEDVCNKYPDFAWAKFMLAKIIQEHDPKRAAVLANDALELKPGNQHIANMVRELAAN